VLRPQEAETKSKAHEVVNSGGAAAAAVPAGSDWSDGLDGYADVPSLTLESFGVSPFCLLLMPTCFVDVMVCVHLLCRLLACAAYADQDHHH